MKILVLGLFLSYSSFAADNKSFANFYELVQKAAQEAAKEGVQEVANDSRPVKKRRPSSLEAHVIPQAPLQTSSQDCHSIAMPHIQPHQKRRPKYFYCKPCETAFSTVDKLERHEEEVHVKAFLSLSPEEKRGPLQENPLPPSSEGKPLQCPICSKLLKSWGNHMAIHNFFTCKECKEPIQMSLQRLHHKDCRGRAD